jgi:hypothetical protein
MGALESPGGGTRNNESIPGVEVLVQWTWTPPGVPPPPPADPVIPVPGGGSARAAARGARVSAGRALVRLACAGDAACEGALELLSRGALRGAAKKITVFGEKRYSIAAGAEAAVKVKLNRRGKRLLRGERRAKAALRITPAGGTAVTSPITLKR